MWTWTCYMCRKITWQAFEEQLLLHLITKQSFLLETELVGMYRTTWNGLQNRDLVRNTKCPSLHLEVLQKRLSHFPSLQAE